MSNPHVTIPSYMSLSDWSSQVAIDLDSYGSFGRLTDESKWQDWAMQFLNNSSLGRNFPDPYKFTDWKEWAERFVQALS